MKGSDRAALINAIAQLSRIRPQLLEAEQPVTNAIRALQDELDTEDD